MRTNGEKVTEAVVVERSSKIDRPVTGSNTKTDGARLVPGPACTDSSAMCRAPWAFGARIFFFCSVQTSNFSYLLFSVEFAR